MSKTVTFFLIMALLCLSAGRLSSAEIDSFTTRNIVLPDARKAVNRIINERIAEGIAQANAIADSEGCDEETLYTELRKAIFQSFTASWGLKGYSLDKQLRQQLSEYSYQLSLNDSIYRDLDYLEAFSLNLKELSDVIRLDGHLIGIDKFGHFFAEGWQYFEMTTEDGKSLAEAMAWGREQEQGKFGYTTTGIFSFADLTANFNGWRFWNNVLGKQADPIKGTFGNWINRAHVSCALQLKESFRQQRLVYAWHYKDNVDIGDYIDAAWDEGQNCNSYADPIIESKIDRRIEELAEPMPCPAQASSCRLASVKYGLHSKWLLHPSCLMSQ